jgi:hypothetical protein
MNTVLSNSIDLQIALLNRFQKQILTQGSLSVQTDLGHFTEKQLKERARLREILEEVKVAS